MIKRKLRKVQTILIAILASGTLLTVGCGGGGGNPTSQLQASENSGVSSRLMAVENFNLDDIATAVDQVQQENPKLDIKSSEFGDKVADNLTASSKTRSYNIEITPEEIKLLKSYWWNAPSTYAAANAAKGKTAEYYPSTNAYLDRADGFRHSYWNVLLCRYISPWWAEVYTNAHESRSQGLNKSMDLHNNRVGRYVSSIYQGYWPSELAPVLRDWVSSLVTTQVQMDRLTNTIVHLK
jgi:hypothetical protein